MWLDFCMHAKFLRGKNCGEKRLFYSPVEIYFRSLIPPRAENKTKYAKSLFIINANLATYKITIGGIRDLKYISTVEVFKIKT